MSFIPRAIEQYLRECLVDTPVIVITGPRQAGKTSLAQHLLGTFESDAAGSYLTLDDENILTIARNDPVGLLRSQSRPVIIDEIQRAPELIRTIKLLVDEDRRPGSFILTGSADLMTLPALADSLAGRAEFVTLYPFSLPELNQQSDSVTDIAPRLLQEQFWAELPQLLSMQQGSFDIWQIIEQGGYPEPLKRAPERRARWHQAYVKAIIQRDVQEIFQLQKLDELGVLLTLLAGLSSETLNYTTLAKAVQMDSKSVQKYICALENLYLIQRIPAWHRNELKRVIKQPKVHFLDTGLLCALRGIRKDTLKTDPGLTGALMETWVCSELLKAIAVCNANLKLFHYRDKDKQEVDFILTGVDQRATGIEVKAGMTIQKKMFTTLEKLVSSGSIQQGIIIYNGERILPFSDQLAAVPAGLLFR